MGKPMGTGDGIEVGGIESVAPGGLELRALGGSGFRRFRASLQQRLIAENALAEGDTAGDQRGRQIKRHLEKFAHPSLLRLGEDGKRIRSSADHGHAVGERRKPAAHGVSGVVGK